MLVYILSQATLINGLIHSLVVRQNLLQDAGVRVDGYIGQSNPAGGFKHVDVAVCTIEKANSLVNRLVQEGAIDQLGTRPCAVVSERMETNCQLQKTTGHYWSAK